MRTFRIAAGCTTLLALALVARQAHSVCQDTPSATNATDLAMQGNNPCGNPTLTDDQRHTLIATYLGDFDMVSDDWGNRGTTTCAPSFGPQGMSTEVAKFFNAAVLFQDGVFFARSQSPGFIPVGAQSFHGSELTDSPSGDYGLLTLAQSSNWHGWMRYQVVDVLSPPLTNALFDPRFGIGIPDLVQSSCLMFDSPFSFERLDASDPVYRAATMIHEAWHAWENIHVPSPNTACGHTFCPGDHVATPSTPSRPPPPPGKTYVSAVSCNAGTECDIWYPHPQGACPPVPDGCSPEFVARTHPATS